jgi:hypothetical protein
VAAPIVTESVDELFAALLSPGVATVAVLLIVPVAEALTATTKAIVLAEAPEASGPGFVQVTTCAEAPQVHPDPVADTNVKLASSVSATVIVPVVGPAVAALLTAMLKVPLVPAGNDPVWLFTMATSGAVGILIVVESLVDAADAVPPPDTLTWFTCGEVADADTFTVTVRAG